MVRGSNAPANGFIESHELVDQVRPIQLHVVVAIGEIEKAVAHVTLDRPVPVQVDLSGLNSFHFFLIQRCRLVFAKAAPPRFFSRTGVNRHCRTNQAAWGCLGRDAWRFDLLDSCSDYRSGFNNCMPAGREKASNNFQQTPKKRVAARANGVSMRAVRTQCGTKRAGASPSLPRSPCATAGIAGGFIAVPILVTLKVICDHVGHFATLGDCFGRQ
jgi:hypothetical protein